MKKDSSNKDICPFCGEPRLNLDVNLDIFEGKPGEKGLCVNCKEGRRQYFKYGFTRKMKKYDVFKDVEEHSGYKGKTLSTEEWLAEKLEKLTGIKFKKNEDPFDIDLVSVDHDPIIYIEVEWTMEGKGKWPKGYPYPVTWMRKSGRPSIPARKLGMFLKHHVNCITLIVKINHEKDECFFTDGETMIKRGGNVITRENIMSNTKKMSKKMIELEEHDIYHGFFNLDTFIKRLIARHKGSRDYISYFSKNLRETL